MGELLSTYLNDHLAGATVGVELARRLHSSNRDEADFGPPLARIRTEIEADRETLRGVMRGLSVRPSTVKPALAWAGERLGRLKLNGRLRGYSPLSRVLELEGLRIGIAGKIELWKVLEQTLGAEWEGHDFRSLAERAERQRATLGDLHRSAAGIAFQQKR